jgi:hypothetical protein
LKLFAQSLVDDALGAIGQTRCVVGAECHLIGTAATPPRYTCVWSALAGFGCSVTCIVQLNNVGLQR